MQKKAFFLFALGWVLLLGCTVNNNPHTNNDLDGTITNDIQQSSHVGDNASNQKRDVPITDATLPYQNSKTRTEKVTHVMIHFISNAGVKPNDPYNAKDVYRIFLDYGLSAHYMIGRDGEIYQLVDESRVAFHSGKGNLPEFPTYQNKMNEYSIGIELLAVGTRDEMLSMMSGKTYDSINPSDIGYTDAQYRSLNLLLETIFDRYPSVLRNRKHVVGHDEYAPERKTDPGSLFDWSRIRFKQTNDEKRMHVVEQGESLWFIAQKYGTTVDTIVAANGIDPNDYIWVGQELIIPGKEGAGTEQPKERSQSHVVEQGESLWFIAQKYGTTIDAIAAANGIDPNDYLLVGQELVIPE
ncbi:LysM peptidoglycan-binding domain-containing protein [Terrihalobacillus insolitus]|uniref:LysM peptidoglycan-binding domain-containing protein n=1 Tax=Terrihalobacillus insolitus TaxID=2950438 RepID=UPI00234020E7|nr:LysM peptidoglycan-binding domain-containing protein [Terrihalobacillus insolitus]MDC3413233.1 LysM peptidoglycan-binding domain-containing protein [Terrihalobacillus insolitus]